MLPEIRYDETKGDLHVNFVMLGVVFIAYTFKYWSANSSEAKILLEEPGNNQQDHDDHFDILPGEDAASQDKRIIHFGGTAFTSQTEDTLYQVVIEVYQNLTALEKKKKLPASKLIGSVGSKVFTISEADGFKFPVVMAQLVSI